jgi:hypothetical protein
LKKINETGHKNNGKEINKQKNQIIALLQEFKETQIKLKTEISALKNEQK